MGAMVRNTVAETVEVLAEAPEELTRGRLKRLGEGIGKVVYASKHWVVKRPRQPNEILALIVLWKVVRKLDRALPGRMAEWLVARPGRQMRALRLLVQAGMRVAPAGLWYTSHVKQVFRLYRKRDLRGETLARARLEGTDLMPRRVQFPPTRVKVGGWPGWLWVEEATERIECTLEERINDLARARRFDEIEVWLHKLLDCRQAGWRRGVFSLDFHLKNFGVADGRVVLLDAGGLTNRWEEIEDRLGFEDTIMRPHAQLGLEYTLRDRPDIAERFDSRWKEIVSERGIRMHWPEVAG